MLLPYGHATCFREATDRYRARNGKGRIGLNKQEKGKEEVGAKMG